VNKIRTFLNRYSEGIFILLLLTFSAGMFCYSFTIVGLSTATDRIGPALMPRLIFGAMAVLSILLIFDYISRLRAQTATPTKEAHDHTAMIRGAISIVGILGFVFLMDKLGFLLSSMLYLYFEIYLLGPKEKRRPLLWALMVVVFCILVYYLFRYQVFVKLPKGILG